jgi:antitoxin component of RelBE/YafQ-DinJ toxin-antitoxin module
MAEQVLIQFRADKELKQEVSDIYEQLGIKDFIVTPAEMIEIMEQ